MSQVDAKMTAPVSMIFEGDETVDAVMTGVAESYEGHVGTRSDMPRPAPADDSMATARVLPAWIKTQVEQLEMRRKARYLAGRPELSHMQKID